MHLRLRFRKRADGNRRTASGHNRPSASAHDSRGSTVYLAASVGGHLELLEALASVLGDRPRVWVTTDGARPRALIDRGEDVRLLASLDRRSFSLARLLQGVKLAIRVRPAVVITSGAGVVAPFCLAARLLGAKLLFVETMARVRRGSVAGRALAPFAHAILIQWQELQQQYPSATVCAPLLLEDLPPIAPPTGRGTFVSVGAHPKPFKRLLDAVGQALADDVLPFPALAQVGVGRLGTPSVRCEQTLDPCAFSDAVQHHRVIVCHGGAGVIATVLRHGKRPMVMARRSDLDEHVDGHQVELLRKLTQLRLIVEIEDQITVAHTERCFNPEVAPEASFAHLPSLRREVERWLGVAAA